jgi:hypothetical protein
VGESEDQSRGEQNLETKIRGEWNVTRLEREGCHFPPPIGWDSLGKPLFAAGASGPRQNDIIMTTQPFHADIFFFSTFNQVLMYIKA